MLTLDRQSICFISVSLETGHCVQLVQAAQVEQGPSSQSASSSSAPSQSDPCRHSLTLCFVLIQLIAIGLYSLLAGIAEVPPALTRAHPESNSPQSIVFAPIVFTGEGDDGGRVSAPISSGQPPPGS